jgi:hypothetical protein
MYFSILLILPYYPYNELSAAMYGHPGAKNSNFGQTLNYSEKSEKITENLKHQYESTVQI